jgi:hypothetical protein
VADKLSEEEIRTKNIALNSVIKEPDKPNIDLMVDVETLGVNEGCPILSIAAIAFNRADILQHPMSSITKGKQVRSTVSYYDTFTSTVSLLDCLASGCTIEAGTANWWLKQKDKSQLVQAMAFEESIEDTLMKFKAFINKHDYGSIWAKSPTFDFKLLRALAKIKNIDIGINFRKEADVRTEIIDYPQFDVVKLSESVTIQDSLGNPLRPHDPVYDCIIQIQAITEVYAHKFS